MLANDDNAYLRKIVAENANTPVRTLEFLAKDDDADVRNAIAENANTPGATRRRIGRAESGITS